MILKFIFKKCNCARLASWIINNNDNYFNKMVTININKEAGTLLKKCNKCGQYWQVDEEDKWCYHIDTGLAIKINEPLKWLTTTDIELRAEAMIEHHGGLSSNICLWSGCTNKALADMVFCQRCAYTHMSFRM